MWNQKHSMGYYLDDETDVIERVAFIFLSVVYSLGVFVIFMLLFITCPVWIIPYRIFKNKKRCEKEQEQDENCSK